MLCEAKINVFGIAARPNNEKSTKNKRYSNIFITKNFRENFSWGGGVPEVGWGDAIFLGGCDFFAGDALIGFRKAI